MKISGLIFAFSFFFTQIVWTQNKAQAEKVLKQIRHYHQADSLQKIYPLWHIRAETLSSNDTVNLPFLKKPALGEISKTTLEGEVPQKFLIKLLNIEVQQLCRVEYIFLDGDVLTTNEIDSIRAEIHRRIQRGEKFHDMIGDYSMDKSPADMGWFSREMVVPAFFDAILKHVKGDVFDFVMPASNWHYIVHKTHENIIKELFYSVWIRIQ